MVSKEWMGTDRRRGCWECTRSRGVAIGLLGLALGVASLAGSSVAADSSVASDPSPTGVSPATDSASGPEARTTTTAELACDEALALRAAKAIQAYYDGIRDLAADFEQTSQSVVLGGASLAEAETQRGKVVFAKPGKMRWSYEEPEPSLVVSDGETIWIHDVAEKQASRLAVTSGYLAGAALQFLLGEGDLVATFEITPVACGEDSIVLDLSPREPASYERLGLTARLSTGQISDTTISDLFGNRTRIRFDRVRVDLDPAAELFTFDPPPGVEVTDLGVAN
jgi:outer membrane lipoprotein carrier protein